MIYLLLAAGFMVGGAVVGYLYGRVVEAKFAAKVSAVKAVGSDLKKVL